MKLSIKKSMTVLLIVAVISLITATIVSGILLKQEITYNRNFPVVNTARVETNTIIQRTENNFGRISDYDFFRGTIRDELDRLNCNIIIIDLTGKPLFDSDDNRKVRVGATLDIKRDVSYDLSFRNNEPALARYSSPIIIRGQQKAIAVFDIPRNRLIGNVTAWDAITKYYPVIISGLIILIIFIYLGHKIKKEIINPLNILNNAAAEISKGNLDIKINYEEEDEMGNFSRAFDYMREELKFSITRQNELEESRKELIACISHDLRTPISSIKAYVEGLRDGLAKDPATTNRYLNVIKKKTDELSKLINDLFEHSQAELGKMKIALKEVYSGELLNKVLAPMKMEFDKSGIELIVEEPLPNVLINADPERIEQVILNLLSNAKKYTPAGGSITISSVLEDNFVKVCVKDTGQGVALEDMPYIFDRFYRGEKSRSREYGGVGLGLYICKYIIDNHGGTIEVQSTPNVCTIFMFTIPKI